MHSSCAEMHLAQIHALESESLSIAHTEISYALSTSGLEKKLGFNKKFLGFWVRRPNMKARPKSTRKTSHTFLTFPYISY